MNSAASEKQRLERLISLYSKSMMNAAFSVLNSRCEAEDAVQDTFVKLFAGNYHFNDEQHEKAWLLRVTINNARNRLRTLKRMAVQPDIPAPTPSIDEDRLAVFDAVHSLDIKYRIVIHLHFYEGCTIREIAEILGIPPSTAGTRLERAKAQLRRLLDEEE